MVTAKTRTQEKSNSSTLIRFLPVTAGTCLLVSTMVPCSAAGGQGNARHPFVNSGAPKFGANQQQLRISRFAATGLEGRSYNLDLSSLASSVVLGNKLFDGATSVTIDVGGMAQTFRPGDQVTPAQFVAIQQVLSDAPQSLKLNSDGAATGGTFSLNQAAAGKVGDLVVPENVTAFNHVTANRVLGLSGDLTNNGSIYGYSTSQKARTGIISADDISNTGLISTDLSGAFATNGLQKHVNLNLNADKTFANSGTISSSGELNISTANGAFSNTGTLSAFRDVNIGSGSGSINNGGTVISSKGDINLNTLNPVDLTINATGGTFSALSGNINVRNADFIGAENILMQGGDYLSKNLNITGGAGSIDGNVGQVTGELNSTGYAAHFYAATDTLTLGSNKIDGDPTWANSAGDVVINGGVVANEAITILASGNITASGDAYISTANSAGLTGVPNTAVTLVAGFELTITGGKDSPTVPGGQLPTGATVKIDFSKVTGGNVDLRGSKHEGPIINTSSTLDGTGNTQENGGNVLIAAGSTDSSNGLILFDTGSYSIDSSSLYGDAGDVTVIAGGSSLSTKSPTIRLGTINASVDPLQSAGTAGTIDIQTAQPQASTGTVVEYDSKGEVVGAATIVPGTIKAGGLVQLTGDIFTTDNVSIKTGTAGGLIQTGDGRIHGTDVLIDTGTFGTGSSKQRILTAVLDELTLSTKGSGIFVDNLGSVTLPSALVEQAGGIFDLRTTPDGAGNGQITIGGDIKAATGKTLGSIILQSSEAADGVGGIQQTKGTLTATTVNLSDGEDGLGFGDIGASATPIKTGAGTLNVGANTQGSVFLEATGALILLPSSAGNGQTFKVNVITDAGSPNGQITLAGSLEAENGRIGTIDLNSSEFTGGKGGITVFGKGKIKAETVILSDGGGKGNADLGAPFINLSVEASKLSVNTEGNVFVENTIKSGMLLNSSHAGSAKSFNLTSASGITTNDVKAGLAVNIFAGSSNGYIIVQDDIEATDTKNGVVRLIAAGAGSITNQDSSGDHVIAKTVILSTSNKGGGIGTETNPFRVSATDLQANATTNTYIYDEHIGDAKVPKPLNLVSALSKGQFSLTSDDAITVTGAITNAKGIRIATTDVIDTKQGITVNADVGSSKSTQTVEIISGGDGAITSKLNTFASKGLVSFTSAAGDIGDSKNALKVLAPKLSANTLGGTGIVNIAVQASKKVGTTLLDSASSGDFTLTSASSLHLTNLFTEDGSININVSGSELTTAENAVIQVGDPSAKAPGNRTITLQNSAAKGGSIFIGANSQISTFVTTPGSGSGNIMIFTGTPDKTPTNKTAPANVKVVSTTGDTFFGKNSITALGPENVMNNVGADIIFDTGGLPPSAITLGGGVTITADPPVTGTAPTFTTSGGSSLTDWSPQSSIAARALVNVDQGTSSSPAIGNSGIASGSTIATSNSGIATGSTIATNNSNMATSASNMAVTTGETLASNGSSFSEFGTLAASVATAYKVLSSAVEEQSQGDWISETELANGEIPAAVHSEMELGIPNYRALDDRTPVVEIRSRNASEVRTAVGSSTRGGGTEEESTRGIKTLHIERGAVVFAPTEETYISTPVGKIKLGARSLALVMAVESGISVYDLDDAAKGSVSVMADGKVITLCPGMHVSITRDTTTEFADINPAQMIGYRAIAGHAVGDRLKAYTAEFSIPHAISAVQPLKHLLESKHPNAKKIAGRLLKTTAALMQLGYANGRYEQVFRSQKTAYNQ